MSTLIRAARPILVPGWDDAPIDRPRRRSAWWWRLLSGAAGVTRFQPGACCGCGHTCGVCGGLPDTLTFSYTFTARFNACADFSSSCTLTWNGTSAWVGVMSMPDCASCGLGAPGWTTFHAVFSCSAGGALSLGFPEWGDPSCVYPATGPGAVGTFTCSPLLWARSDAGSSCPAACAFGSTGDMFLKWSWTISA